ncbi:MAG: stage II sporulation protein R [Clostridia bacterium]|nr:stage II sporulation protein R [Clostridia bacterium]
MATKISKKAFEWALVFGFICSVFWSMASFDANCEELRDNVLRLHIVANSDSKADQELKLKIRDEILKKSETLFEKSTDLNSALQKAEENLENYEQIANRVIKEQGFNYSATAKIGKRFFETRVYDDFTLPAGEYDALIVELGEGVGKNWWCVIFPGVCVPTEKGASLKDSVGEKSAKIAENPKPYKMRFKSVEIYEKIKRKFK